MHGVKLDDGEIALIKEAREKRDWTILPTFKLKYVYQRLVALPRGDMAAVKAIQKQAQVAMGKAEEQFVADVEEALI